MKNIFKLLAIIILILIVSAKAGYTTPEVNRYIMRFPDIHKETVIFVYGEDIWKAPVTGGIAQRLTIHEGAERFPKFSADGKLIAFTANYDGNSDVYVMNSFGGEIRRITYHPGYDEVVGWHVNKNKIIFRSGRLSFRLSRLFLISPDGTGLETLIMDEAVAGSFSPDGTKIAYNKGSRESRTWKRYQGGTAQEVYLYDFKTNQDTNLTKFNGTDRIPMWVGNTIYFTSDRNFTLNIFGYNTETKMISQITFHDYYDVRRPSKGLAQIVYENGGNLWALNLKSKKSKVIPIKIQTDLPETRPYHKNVKNFITGFDCSPSAKRALIVARGEIFTVPKKFGPTRNLSQSSGSREKDAAWSPNGKYIAFISDKDGEYQIYLMEPTKITKATKLTSFNNGYRHTLRWSPDSKKIAFTDQKLQCYYIDIKNRVITAVDRALFENIDVSLDNKPIYDFQWSPDSRYIAYSKMDSDLVNKVYIYSLPAKKSYCISGGLFNEFHPVFSVDGKHLFFVSNRRFNPTLCDFEWEMVYKDMAGIYAVTLQKNGQSVLPFKSDEEAGKTDFVAKKSKKNKDTNNILIDFEGLSERVEALPLPRGNYRYLSVNKKDIFFLNGKNGDYNRFEFRLLGPQNLEAFNFDKRKKRIVISGVKSYKLSADGSYISYQKGSDIGLIKSDTENSKGNNLVLTNLKMYFEPLKEWQQIVNEAWRIERDFYYDPKMKGVDWSLIGKKYKQLVPFASCRQDIRFLIGEMIGELNTSHTYVFGGDAKRKADLVNIGLLGADWQRDQAKNLYRFKKIFRVHDWSRNIAPPLAKPGVIIKEGDYLLEVNGMTVNANKNIYSYFEGLAGKQVTLLVNSQPMVKGAKKYTVKPARSEYRLRYLDWVEHNRKTVLKASNGQIGYIHLPDTYLGSAIEFPKYFYSQLRRKGIIVDGRFNGGGLDPDIFLARLDKKIHSYWTRRYSHHQTSPSTATRAHMVCLTDRHAGSGGDELPMLFRKKGMGPIIGTRSWGGLVGVSMFIRMIDGGGISAPDYRIYDEKGNWVVENIGIVPDIEIDLHPAEVARGFDAQLMKGVEVLLKKIKQEPRPWPKHDAWPVDKKK